MTKSLPNIAPNSLPSGEVGDRVCRLSRAAWGIRERSGQACDLPFAFALFTDDRRQGDILSLLSCLPHGKESGTIAVVFRHDHLLADIRRGLAMEALALVKAKGHVFLMARAMLPGADGTHGIAGKGVVSMPIHSYREGVAARRAGANLGFVGPVFKTDSHPGGAFLGPACAAGLAQAQPFPCFALGGVNFETIRRLRGYPFAGIACIGAVGG